MVRFPICDLVGDEVEVESRRMANETCAVSIIGAWVFAIVTQVLCLCMLCPRLSYEEVRSVF
jgi:hypothetical protein